MKERMIKEKVKQAIKEAGLTQSELGKKLNITHPLVNNWVTGRRNPSLKSLKKIASATGKPLNYFLDNSNDVTGDNSINLAGRQKIDGGIHYGIQKSVEQYHEILKEMQLFNEKLKSLDLKLDLLIERLKK
ncbi:MAG: helix-turn-helix domain-containing protein [Endomicrobium sp.]|jgi:transcriptional regulator with XRE-family HTH domain|nr:helix-turn-helix domain-containing protein [Endomicrobium sp.]